MEKTSDYPIKLETHKLGVSVFVRYDDNKKMKDNHKLREEVS